jgi:predicted RNA-binding protein with PUA-like domain
VGYWLMKTEPSEFSLQHLRDRPGQTGAWDGVRNYQSRNYMRDQMRLEDRVLFYHSSCDPTAIVGTARIAREGYPDHTAWEPGGAHFDPKSSPANPIWMMVDVRFESEFPVPLTLEELRTVPALKDMLLLRRGMRLSIQPVTEPEFQAVLAHAALLAQRPPAVQAAAPHETALSPAPSAAKAQPRRTPRRGTKAQQRKPRRKASARGKAVRR